MGYSTFQPLHNSKIKMFTQTFWITLILAFWKLFVFIHSEIISGNTLSAMSISFGSLINCNSCSDLQVETYCTGCSYTWMLEMLSINLTINSHQDNDFEPSSAFLNHSIGWDAAPGSETGFGARLDPWYWFSLQFLPVPRITGKVLQKLPLRKW